MVAVTRRLVHGLTDPANPRNLERSLQPGDVAELRGRFADLIAEAPTETVPPWPPA